MKPICFLFLSVTRINPCLKQQRYQKKLQMTHSNDQFTGAYWLLLQWVFIFSGPFVKSLHFFFISFQEQWLLYEAVRSWRKFPVTLYLPAWLLVWKKSSPQLWLNQAQEKICLQGQPSPRDLLNIGRSTQNNRQQTVKINPSQLHHWLHSSTPSPCPSTPRLKYWSKFSNYYCNPKNV